MNIALWVIQALAALAFLGAGFMKSTRPIKKLQENMGWVKATPPVLIRLLGVAEILGGLGLILPAALKLLPWLTPTAAVALAVIMVGAIVVHINEKEAKQASAPLILLILTLIIVIGRIWLAPIA
jgi:putative oxidoreductase